MKRNNLKKMCGKFFPAFVFLIVTALWFATPSFFKEMDLTERGTYGDMFGAPNALFSGLAFAGIIYTILLQRNELRLQRLELRLTRKELRGQRGEFEKQNNTLRRQRFENTFFQMLNLHNQIVSSIGGREKIESLMMTVYRHIKATPQRHEPPDETPFERSWRLYSSYYEGNQSELGHYFRWLYRMIRFVDESDIEDKDKRFYTDLVRAQLSNQELQLLFYNCLSGVGYKKFKPLVEKYSLLNNIPYDAIVYPDEMFRNYDVSAYGSDFPKRSR